jgi:hypothetical protein
VVAPDPATGRAVAKRLRARLVTVGDQLPREANVLYFAPTADATRFEVKLRRPGAGPGSPVRMLFLGDLHRLLRRPWPFRFRYEVRQ